MKALIPVLFSCLLLACSKPSDQPVKTEPIDLVAGNFNGKKLEIQQVHGDTSNIHLPTEIWEDYSFSALVEIINHNTVRVTFNTDDPIIHKTIELPLANETTVPGGTQYEFSANIRKPEHYLSSLIRIQAFSDTSKPVKLFVNFVNATIKDRIMDQESILASAEK